MNKVKFEEEAKKIIEEESKEVRHSLFEKALGEKYPEHEEI